MGKALSTGYRTKEQQEVLSNLDDQLGNYYRALHNEGKSKSPSSSSEKTPSKEVEAKKTSGNAREYRDSLRSEMVAVAKRGDKRKAVGLAIALGVAQGIL